MLQSMVLNRRLAVAHFMAGSITQRNNPRDLIKNANLINVARNINYQLYERRR